MPDPFPLVLFSQFIIRSYRPSKIGNRKDLCVRGDRFGNYIDRNFRCASPHRSPYERDSITDQGCNLHTREVYDGVDLSCICGRIADGNRSTKHEKLPNSSRHTRYCLHLIFQIRSTLIRFVHYPGRLGALLECGALKVTAMKMIIMDEADKLFDENLQEQTKYSTLTPPLSYRFPLILLLSHISFIFKCLPKKKQVLAFSATFSSSLIKTLSSHMTNPQHITLIADTLSLEGKLLAPKLVA